MDLFNPNGSTNLLPYDGEVMYYGPVLGYEQAAKYFNDLMTGVPWQNDEVVVMGERIQAKRKVAWYGDKGQKYTYSGTTRTGIPWNNNLLTLNSLVEEKAGASFNSCLLNLYETGDVGVSWHSDDETMLGKEPVIASLSLGAARKFSLKHKKTKQSLSVWLENGSLLVMKGATQIHWLHCVPKTKKVNKPRISLTFRTIVTA